MRMNIKPLLLIGTIIAVLSSAADRVPVSGDENRPTEVAVVHDIDVMERQWNALFMKASSLDDKAKAWSEIEAGVGSVNQRFKEIAADPKYLQTPLKNVSVEGVPVAGMDPSGIKDLKVRANYEEAIRLNKEVITASNYKLSLQRLLRKMLEQSKSFVQSNSEALVDAPKKLKYLNSIAPSPSD